MVRKLFFATGIAAILFGVLYYYTEQEIYLEALGVSAGISVIFLALKGKEEGEYSLRPATIRKDEKPTLFWFVYVFYLLGGAGIMGAAFYSLIT